MTHTYKVDGMTCNGCKASVQNKLMQLENVTDVSVDLEKGEAEVVMNQHVSTEVLKNALPDKYQLSEKEVEMKSDPIEPFDFEEESKWQQLKPLFLILLYISVASVLLHWENWDMQAIMLDFMGLFYIVFSFFKMLDLKGFPDSFRMYDPLAKRIPVYAKVYPFIETILGLMFLLRFQVEIALVATIIILGITTVGVTKTLLDKRAIRCACLGTALKLPMTEATFIENAIMLVMAIILLINLF
jgi:cation transport ATPase